MRVASFLSSLLLLVASTSATSSVEVFNNHHNPYEVQGRFAFSIKASHASNNNKKGHANHRKQAKDRKTLRHRRTTAKVNVPAEKKLKDKIQEFLTTHNYEDNHHSHHNKKAPAQSQHREAITNQAALTAEDKAFWDRLLQDGMAGSMPPSPCPVRIEVDCVTQNGGLDCRDVDVPASGNSDQCIVPVQFTYTFTNDSNEVERIYSLTVMRGSETMVVTNLAEQVPTVDLAPGQTVSVTQTLDVNVCEDGLQAFDTQADILTGPPCDVEVVIACMSEEGEECQSISEADTTDACLLDVTYTYTVTNTGAVDANIISFTREREGDSADLMDELSTTFIALGDSTVVTETEEVDRCVDSSFTTNTRVVTYPNAELLCKDTGFYESP